MRAALREFVSQAFLRWLQAAGPDAEYARRFNRIAPLRTSLPVRLSYDDARGLFGVSEGEAHIWVARRARLAFHERGLGARRATLMREYLVPQGLVRPGDLVVDCGANIGEFALACAAEGATVLAFEPDPREFAALVANAETMPGIQPFHCALWNAAGTLPFFDKNDTGDSSLIDPGGSEGAIMVDTVRLDSIDALPAAPHRIRLLKVEAEGGEPEVLEGCGDLLARTDYVAADLGPERGIDRRNTVSEVVEFLQQRDFRMIDFFPPRCSALFVARSLGTAGA